MSQDDIENPKLDETDSSVSAEDAEGSVESVDFEGTAQSEGPQTTPDLEPPRDLDTDLVQETQEDDLHDGLDLSEEIDEVELELVDSIVGPSHVSQASESGSDLSALARGSALLMGMGASIGLGIWALLNRSILPDFVRKNVIEASLRETALVYVAVGVVVPMVLIAAALIRGRKNWAGTAIRIERLAWSLSPFCLAGLMPLLFQWQLWVKANVTFLTLVGCTGLVTQKLVYRSLSTPSVFPPDRNPWTRFKALWERFDQRTSAWLPWVIVIVAFIFYTAYFSFYTVQNHWNLRTLAYDMGIEDNILFNTLSGEMMKCSPAFGPEGTHLGHHATFFAFLITPIYALAPQAETLLVFQAALIGAAVIPLFLFARNRLGPWIGATIAVLYIFYAPGHGANLYDFHYPPLGIGFVFWTAYLVDTQRYRWAALTVVLALSVREDISLGLVALGAYFLFSGRRSKAGLVIAIVSAAYFLIMKMGVMPAIRDGKESFHWLYKDMLPPDGEKGFKGVLMTLVGNPGYTLSTLLTKAKFIYVLKVIVPFLFIPWRRGIGFLFCVPALIVTLLPSHPAMHSTSYQYTAHWTIGLFLAAVFILSSMGTPSHDRDTLGRTRVRSWMCAWVLAMLATSFQYGAVLQQNTAWGGPYPFKFERTEKDIQRYEDLWTLIRQVPPEAKVAASERILPQLSNRRDAYTLRTVGVADAEYILFSSTMRPRESSRALRALRNKSFGVVTQVGDFYLAQRGYDTSLNRRVLRKLRPRRKRPRPKSKRK